MDPYTFCLLLGALGLLGMSLTGMGRHGHAGQTHGHSGHASHGATQAHGTAHGHSAASNQSAARAGHTGAGSLASRLLWSLMSPRVLFTVLLGAGATGLLLRHTLTSGLLAVVLDQSNAMPEASPIVAESPGELGLPSPAVNRTPPVRAVAPYPYGGRRIFHDSDGLPWEVYEESFVESAVAHRELPLPDDKVVLLFNNDAQTRQLSTFPANWRSLSDSDLSLLLAKATRVRQ